MKWTDQSPSPALPVRAGAREPSAVRELCASALHDQGPLVTVTDAVHSQILAHLRARPVEQGGLLIGRAWGESGNEGQPSLIEILAAIAATDAAGTGYSLRMEAVVWSAANERLAQLRERDRAADVPSADALRVIGWYHSHPGLGVFFSSTDCATQRAFFNHPWSVGWVIDPDDDSHAVFVGADSMAVGRCLLVR